MRSIFPALLCGLWACADVTTLRYQPSTIAITPAGDHGRSRVPRPARGGELSASLSNGFPVWVVHHADGTISVISAVAPARPKGGGFRRDDVAAQVDRGLVSWIPGVRRFYSSGVLFDDRGHALGYANFDGCAGECTRIEDMPPLLRDLDTFRVRPQPDDIEVGQLVEGKSRRRAKSWLPWRRPAAREEDMNAANSPAVRRTSLVDALALAEGQYAIVDGKTVRSTYHRPVICESTKAGTCGTCGTEQLPLGGIIASDAAHIHSGGWWKNPGEYKRDLRREYASAEPGTFLVRRQRDGFQIVAGVFRGICSGSW